MRYQQLTEIDTGVSFEDSDYWDKVQQVDFDDRQGDLFGGERDYRKVGTLDQYDVIEVNPEVRVTADSQHMIGYGKGHGGGQRYILLDRTIPIAYIDLIHHSSEFGMAAQVVGVRVADAVNGKGIGLKLYLWLLTHGFDALYADESQTGAGAAVWKRLFVTPGVKLYYEKHGTWRPIRIKSLKTLEKVWDYDFYNLLASLT